MPPRSGEMCSSSMSSMLIRSAPSACEDPRQHARAVGDVDDHALQLARVVERARQHAAAVAGRVADPARQEPGVARLERPLQPLQLAAVIGEQRRRRRRRCPAGCPPRCAGSRPPRASCRGTTRPRPRAGRCRRCACRPPGSRARSRARAGGARRSRPAGRARPARWRTASPRARRRSRAPAGSAPGRCRAAGRGTTSRRRRASPSRARARAARRRRSDGRPGSASIRPRRRTRPPSSSRRRSPCSRRRSSRACRAPASASAATGAATTASSASGERGGERVVRLVDRAALGRDGERMRVGIPAGRRRRPRASPPGRRTRRSGPCRRVPARRGDMRGSADLLAHEGCERADLAGELREVRVGDLLRPVAERLARAAGAPRR